ncbi:hypothetical protein PR003_g11812 [Phytophthora rubi]|uniref:Uncharacterized protein n=1 Tax=Phytophthora rubi TaxID=129364 RepID=A0A6A4BIA4_9STRA|nr:hypothetical protein PR001_g28884 [Phytophthora rubi]KAE8965439.1 hypothetical protein PR002_g28677 [Phytophthora rubi]KAE9018899.1 hypothetical protein PR002_g12969 [Phytophthora rubi]KAE9023706.1 hypothetical protein PR001_g12846 [Phytophthora rubi]KAE9273730.1 hypothetical protein PR003_g29817 [Phytophthora rubi]
MAAYLPQEQGRADEVLPQLIPQQPVLQDAGPPQQANLVQISDDEDE